MCIMTQTGHRCAPYFDTTLGANSFMYYHNSTVYASPALYPGASKPAPFELGTSIGGEWVVARVVMGDFSWQELSVTYGSDRFPSFFTCANVGMLDASVRAVFCFCISSMECTLSRVDPCFLFGGQMGPEWTK
jgi:hypothetical protein